MGFGIHEIDGNQTLFSAMTYNRENSSKQDQARVLKRMNSISTTQRNRIQDSMNAFAIFIIVQKFSDHACWRLIHICHHYQQEIAFVKTTLKFPSCCTTSKLGLCQHKVRIVLFEKKGLKLRKVSMLKFYQLVKIFFFSHLMGK